MTDVFLVAMPYCALERPSPALGVLKARLASGGIEPEVLHANLWFAEVLGLPRYQFVLEYPSKYLMGEWTFSGAAFPDFQPDHSEYLRRVCEGHPRWEGVLWSIRSEAQALVDRVATRVLESRPRIVGCTSTVQQHAASLALLRRIREWDPEVVTLLGGANCEGSMGRATHEAFPWIDFVCSGEADDLILDLVRTLLERGRAASRSELPPGVLGPDHRGRAANGEVPRAVAEDLSRVPIPDYRDYFRALEGSALASYIHPAIPIETSRGCWWGQRHHCTFCGRNGQGMAFRAKEPRRIVDEVVSLARRHGVNRFGVLDSILDLAAFRTVLPEFERMGAPYSFLYETKANLRRDQVAALARAGVRFIQPGIESLDDPALELMAKGTSTAINLQLLRWAREHGLHVRWNFLVGIPGEARERYADVARWLPQLAHLQPPMSNSRIQYFRFSPYHMNPERYGLPLAPRAEYAYVYPLPPERMEDLAYYFEDTRPESEAATQAVEYRLLSDAIASWTREFWSSSPPVLEVRRDGAGATTIVDTRPCAMEREFLLDETARRILEACDRLRTPRALAEALGKDGGPEVPAELRGAAVEDLLRRRVLLDLEGRLLSLAVAGPAPPVASDAEFPGGWVETRRYSRDRLLEDLLAIP